MEETKQSLEQQLDIHRQNLNWLEEQRARHGLDAPLHILHGIEYEKQEIKRLTELLKANSYITEADVLLRMAIDLAIAGGRIVLDYYQRNLRQITDVSMKHITTEADERAEERIINGIRAKFGQEHAIIAEEKRGTTDTAKGKGITWVVDGLDGSINFHCGVPLFCTAIGILKDRKPYIGVIYEPVRRELYYAQEGDRAYLEHLDIGLKEEIRTSPIEELDEAVVMTHLTSRRTEREKMTYSGLLDAIANATRHIRMLGSGQLALTYVARGRFQAFLNNYTYPWDQVAGKVILEAAGGKVTDFGGKEWTIESESILACNNERLHIGLFALIKGLYPEA